MTHRIEDMLDSVRYNVEERYIPSTFAIHFISFVRMVNEGNEEQHKTPELHLKMIDSIEKYDDVINIIFRGSAKTTIFSEYMILYCATYNYIPNFGTVDYGIFVGDTIENGVENLYKNIRHRYENSDFLKKMIPKVSWKVTEWSFTNIDKERVVFIGYGARTGVRGTKRLGMRPKIALVDDVISDEDARSKTMVSKIKENIDRAFEYAMNPSKRKVIWSGTPFAQGDPLYISAESGAYKINVFPVCERFDDNTTREEFSGAWEDRFSYDVVRRMYDKAKKVNALDGFYQEMMLRIVNDDDVLIPLSMIPFVSNFDHIINRMTYYLTSDWAVSQNKGSDYAVLSIWGYYQDKWYLVDGFIGREPTDRLIEMIFDFNKRYGLQEITVETNGQQEGFLHVIKRMQAERMATFNIIPIKHPVGTTKFHRIMTEAVPMVRRGELVFSEKLMDTKLYEEAINQLTSITYNGIKSRSDDFLDTVVSLSHLHPYNKSNVQQNYQSNTNKRISLSNPFFESDAFIDTTTPGSYYDDYI